MRLHRLRIKNLNSLYGEHTIDFDGALGEAGLFLIHGPTGAGKSTILDAVCLALFGVTPRLDQPSNQSVDGSDDGAGESDPARIMSRGAGDCAAELEFSVTTPEGARARYRAGFSLHRARKNPESKFQDPVRKLEQLVDGAWSVLVDSTQKKLFVPPFAAVLQGLTFDDFQRTALLAQFAFREFLDADVATRTRLLERMTATGRFRQIGVAAGVARKRAAERQRDLQIELGATSVLTDDARMLVEADREKATADAIAARGAVDALGAAKAHWEQVLALQGAVATAAEEQRAVQQAWLDAKEALARLADDERVAPAREAVTAFRRASTELLAAKTSWSQSVEEQERLVVARDEARLAAATAQAAAADAALARDERAPALAAARLAWEAAATAAREAEQAVVAHGEREARCATARDAAARAREEERVLGQRLDELAAELRAIPAHARLEREAPALAARAESLARDVAALAGLTSVAQHKATERDAAVAKRPALEQAVAAASEAATRAVADVESAREALAAQTGELSVDDKVKALGADRDSARATIDALEQLERALTDHGRLSKQLVEHERLRDEARAQADVHRASLEAIPAERAALLSAAAARDAHLATLQQLLGVIVHRGVLRADEACPVCGSEEHPYRVHPERAPRLDDVQREHDALVASARAGAEQVEALARREAALARDEAVCRTNVANAERQLGVYAGEQRAVHERAVELAARAGVAADAPEDARSSARSAAERAATAADEIAEQIRKLAQELRQREQRAQQQEQAARDAAAELDRHALDADHLAAAARSAEEQRAQREAQVTEARAELAKALAECEVAFEPGAVEQGAQRAAELAAKIAALRTQLQGLEPQRNAAVLATARAAADEATAVTELADAKAALDGKMTARDASRAAAQQHLGGVLPDEVQRALDGAIERSAAELKRRSDVLSEAERLRSNAETVVNERQLALGQAGKRTDEAQAALTVALAAVEAQTPEEVDARSLSAEERAATLARRNELQTRDTTASTKVATAEDALGRRLAARPEGESADARPEVRVVELEALRVEADQARTDADRRLGELSKRLADDDDARAKRAARATELADAEEDLARWSEIYDLIGVNNGDAFVRVVQSLNLGAVLDHANAQLALFMPRYSLRQIVHETDGPLLDFRVVDGYQQDAARTIKSLSGGESFVVSLALALGLAATRASRLRIETLLIDEGFGSLDQATLAQALAALGALQGALGVRIGVISHVDVLKEAIPAQIVVEPQGAGRSIVKVPAGRA